jgi:hypothetical protein
LIIQTSTAYANSQNYRILQPVVGNYLQAISNKGIVIVGSTSLPTYRVEQHYGSIGTINTVADLRAAIVAQSSGTPLLPEGSRTDFSGMISWDDGFTAVTHYIKVGTLSINEQSIVGRVTLNLSCSGSINGRMYTANFVGHRAAGTVSFATTNASTGDLYGTPAHTNLVIPGPYISSIVSGNDCYLVIAHSGITGTGGVKYSAQIEGSITSGAA